MIIFNSRIGMKQSIRIDTVLCLAVVGLAMASAVARADVCDDAVYAAKDFVLQSMRQDANSIADHLVSRNAQDHCDDFQKQAENAATIMKNARHVRAVCGVRYPFQCDVACMEKSAVQTKRDADKECEKLKNPPPDPRSDPKFVKSENACLNVGAALSSGLDDQPTAEILSSIADCNRHPDKTSCKAVDDIMREQRQASPLTCGSAPSEDDATAARRAKDGFARFAKTAKPLREVKLSGIALFDDACSGLAATLTSGAESSQVEDTVKWIASCSRHPTKAICEMTADMIRQTRHADPLTCGDTGPDDAAATARAKDAFASFERSAKNP